MSIGRVIFLVIHIISVGLWIAQFPIGLIFERARRQVDPTMLSVVRMTQGRVISLLGQAGGIGILISGFALIGIAGLGFLGLGRPTPNWLIAKHVFFIIALVLVIALIAPGIRQMSRASNEADVDAIEKR